MTNPLFLNDLLSTEKMLALDASLQFDSAILNSSNATVSTNEEAEENWIVFLSKHASDQDLKTIFYNATNKGPIIKDDIAGCLPLSWPGKLLSFLFQRFKHFNGAAANGLMIVTDAPARNAETLEAIILELAHLNNLPPEFLDWVENANRFIPAA
jgi:tagaturonate reductase